jgi:hypothetical protein
METAVTPTSPPFATAEALCAIMRSFDFATPPVRKNFRPASPARAGKRRVGVTRKSKI